MRKPKVFFSTLLLGLTGLSLLGWALFGLFNPQVIISWSTATEFETAGYHIYRAGNPEGPFEKITPELIPSSGDPLSGGKYEYIDRGVRPGEVYYYRLAEVELSGNTNQEDPLKIKVAWRGILEGTLGFILLVFAGLLAKFFNRHSDERDPRDSERSRMSSP